MQCIRPLLHADCYGQWPQPWGENIRGGGGVSTEVILPADQPLSLRSAATCILRGNSGAVTAVSSSSTWRRSPACCGTPARRRRSRIMRISKVRIDDPALDVTAGFGACAENAGPLGGPGMPEWGMLPIPRKRLLARACATWSGCQTCAHERDELRHLRPARLSREDAVGGPLALVCDGDHVALDTAAERLDLLVEQRELDRRREVWRPSPSRFQRGYGVIWREHVLQANLGCSGF